MSDCELTKPTAANIRERNRKHAVTSRKRKQDSIDVLLRMSHEVHCMHTEMNNLRREVGQLKVEVGQLKEENFAVRTELTRSTDTLNRSADDQFRSINLVRADVNFLIYHAIPDE
jgi:hypothetical protein